MTTLGTCWGHERMLMHILSFANVSSGGDLVLHALASVFRSSAQIQSRRSIRLSSKIIHDEFYEADLCPLATVNTRVGVMNAVKERVV